MITKKSQSTSSIKKVNVELPLSVYEALKKLSEQKNMSMSETVLFFISGDKSPETKKKFVKKLDYIEIL